MKIIKASGLVFNRECFITLCGNGNIPTKRIVDGHVALNDVTVTFNDDRTLHIEGERLDIRYTDKPIRFKDADEASQYRIDDMRKDWRGRLYIPAGWYMMDERSKYSATIQEPWFIDFSDYDFKG